jgi:hypothetical protein
VGSNVIPLSIDFLYKISQLPDISSPHTTYTLSPKAVTIGPFENPQQLLRFSEASKLSPPSIDFLNKIRNFNPISYISILSFQHGQYKPKSISGYVKLDV